MKIVKIVALSCLATALSYPIVGSAFLSGDSAIQQSGAYKFRVADNEVAVNFASYDGTLAEYKVENPDTIMFRVVPGTKPSKELTTFSNFLAEGLGVPVSKIQSSVAGIRVEGRSYAGYPSEELGFARTTTNVYEISKSGAALKKAQKYLMGIPADQIKALGQTMTVQLRDGDGKPADRTSFASASTWEGDEVTFYFQPML